MRFTVDTQEFNAGISTVIKALSSKTSMAILEGIYIEARENDVLLKCTDLSLQIETVIGATVEEEGKIVLPGRILSEMIRKMPNELTSVNVENKTAYIESGRAKTAIKGESSEDYHDMAKIKNSISFKISHNKLKNMIKQCIFATAQDDTKPILTGVLLEAEGNSVTMVALDGYRLAMRKEYVSQEVEAEKIVIPYKSLLEIGRTVTDGDEELTVNVSKTSINIDMGYTTITSRLLDGDFIKYRNILPENHLTRVRISREELAQSIERVSIISREEKTNLISLNFENDKLLITANSEIGKSNEEIDADIIGNDIKIAFNSKYMTDVLKTLDDDEIYLEMNNNISPCIIRPLDGEKFYYLVLPVRHFSE
ncbi:MAG: DNA polymerase III subunit beta [Clostridia bacterium]|nr:DNA polymerase III subunit beta [Clostridia bacterium]